MTLYHDQVSRRAGLGASSWLATVVLRLELISATDRHLAHTRHKLDEGVSPLAHLYYDTALYWSDPLG